MQLFRFTLAATLIASTGIAAAMPPVTIVDQGSFAAGGTVTLSDGVYGDHIPTNPSTHPHEDYWRTAAQMADAFVATVNRHGGDAKVVLLPEIGIYGNTHFMFAEKNNVEVANAFKAWLTEKHLD